MSETPSGSFTMLSPLQHVLAEHVEEAAFVWLQRTGAVHAPNYSPEQFADLDERLEAHIDGIRVAGDEGWALAEAALDEEDVECFFPAAVLALEARDGRWEAIVARAADLPPVAPALVSAMGWVEPKLLSGRVKALLDEASPVHQRLGLAACGVHRQDPGAALVRALQSGASAVRARACRTAGELGRVDLLPAVRAAVDDPKQEARYWAARSAVLLGDRGKALEALVAIALRSGRRQVAALQLALQAADMGRGQEILRQLADLPDVDRLRIVGAACVGSVAIVPWLLDRMEQPLLARVAFETFVTLTGADSTAHQFEAMPPDDFEEGPTEDPDDEDVEVPEDAALSWPDVARVRRWWDRHGGAFDPAVRTFLGQPVTADACLEILRTGFQRQRMAAAVHLALLEPSAPLFNTSAPAHRQQRLLARMS